MRKVILRIRHFFNDALCPDCGALSCPNVDTGGFYYECSACKLMH